MKPDRLTITPYICADLCLCSVCGRCIAACPEQIIGKTGSWWHKRITFENAEECTGCKKCIRACPHGVFGKRTFDTLESIITS